MTNNIADRTPEERAAIAQERALSLERHKAEQAIEHVVEREYLIILHDRSSRRGSWEGWALRRLDDMQDLRVRERVLERLNKFQDSIAAPKIKG